MNKKDRQQQRKIALRYIAKRLREYAKAERDAFNRRTAAVDTGSILPSHAWGHYYGALQMACRLGVIEVYGKDYDRFEKRATRIMDANISRRPFRVVRSEAA